VPSELRETSYSHWVSELHYLDAMRTTLGLALVLGACTVGEVGGPGGPTPDAPVTTPGDDAPPAGGTLQVTFTSTTQNAQYAPRNCVAVWIENNGTFVKTIDRHAQTRKQHLVAWTGAAGAADTDAVSGATRANHQTPITLTWDLEDRTNTVVPDGTYTIRMESTEQNANQAAQNNQGTFTFTKGPQPDMQTGLSNGGFTNVSITFTP
jgi:hypothetical protein